ncbi:hypothetical protein CKM354_000293000 [Cercospora kikuchii]|uniref:Zn(2)-C6 fungal-type domain-containing protein n=1 Tax=Cercospora kikuchii TaxID=84275 RepID=A0A9P3CGN6_9PEZI|nr:uncharacterized protein CKM354_000293000 [Cercospora kikuchii]GIZ39550.1 hypothetical protein CKM354_000293000 [Cercospora kikuchii]
MAPRSRTGCLTCRSRKLKCDETPGPSCANCAKAHRECIKSQGITFRHQQNPSMNGSEQDGLKSFYGYKETFAKSTTWVQVPPELTFVHTNNPYEDDDADDPTSSLQDTRDLSSSSAFDAYPAYATHGLEALSAVATDQYTYAPHPPAMGGHERTSSHTSQPQQQQQQQQLATSGLGLDFILNPASQNVSPVTAEGQSNIDPQLNSHSPTTQLRSPTHVRTSSFASVGGRSSLHSFQGTPGHRARAPIEDPELAYLLRQAKEHSLCWMDLYDLDLFFAAKVPVLAVDCPLLLYSCASLSAKSLARVNGRRPVMGGAVSKQSKMESWPGPPMDAEMWMRKGRECYDIAVSLLRQSLAGCTRPGTSSLPEHSTPATLSAIQGTPLPTTDSDELVAATAILCVYEFLDASGPEWSRHLDGAKTLFDVAREQAMPVSGMTGHSPPRARPNGRGLSLGRRAVFWNFARQDMLSAFINNKCTRLDTTDLSMWRSAGLNLTLDGFVVPSHPRHQDYNGDLAMGDDMISNALIWLLMKLVNFVAAGDEMSESISPLELGVRQRELLNSWHDLDMQLAVWSNGLPDGFQPTAVHACDDEWETEKWFPRAMCASTMQWYHFARIQLLHNKPHVSTANPAAPVCLGALAPGSSLKSHYTRYAAIIAQSRNHAKEIVAIANGRADEGTRIHSVQPLWTAGLVLGRNEDSGPISGHCKAWRSTVVGLLRGIEHDMGWAAEYRVQSLMDLWDLNADETP